MIQRVTSVKSEETCYLQILTYGLSDDTSISPPNVDVVNWNKFFSFCDNQAILGIGLQCIDKLESHLGGDLKIPQDLFLEWIGVTEQIKKQNRLLNKRTKELTDYLIKKGKRSCILKGQGNALMYPDPLLRTAGDIDVWLEGSKKEISKFVHLSYPDMNVQYHHMNYPIFEDVEVEVHYYPSFCYNKWHNNRLQQYFRVKSEEQFQNVKSYGFCVPTVAFNIVFQLSHMMRHFFTQGIGLRHAIDYYYLLKQEISDKQRRDAIEVIKQCGMYKFFCAVIWIETNIFGLDDNKYIALANGKAGQLVLNEMIKGGNFGNCFKTNDRNVLAIYFDQMFYRLKYVVQFPSETLSRPLALVCDYINKRLF